MFCGILYTDMNIDVINGYIIISCLNMFIINCIIDQIV